MKNDGVEDVAAAVLYEGYLLYPYRSSAVKNRQRWNFGVVYPRAYAESQKGSDGDRLGCDCLARGSGLAIRVRFLQLITKETRNERGALVDSWQEAVEREARLSVADIAGLVEGPVEESFEFDGEADVESATVVRRREPLRGIVSIGAEAVGGGWFRLRIEVVNVSECVMLDREAALPYSFVSTHAILRLAGGEFASLLEPPGGLAEAAAGCRNAGLQPVLAGDSGSRDVMLCSPVILYDYPRIAPESAGALFDGTEIDEILSLRILTMTDEEKREMRNVDPIARRLLERTEALTPEQFMQMHGALRTADAGGES